MENRFKCIIQFILVFFLLIAILSLITKKTFSSQTTINLEKTESVKEHLITGDVYIVCLNGVKYYYIEDGISKLGIAPVYGTDGRVMLCRRK